MQASPSSLVYRRLVRPTTLIAGIGLHRARPAQLRLAPRPIGAGLALRRVDLEGTEIPLGPTTLFGRERRTVVRDSDGLAAETLEHVLAACVGLGCYDVSIELNGLEAPAVDGSASDFAEALWSASIDCRRPPAQRYAVRKEFIHQEGRAYCCLRPHGHLVLECSIEFAHSGLGQQRFRFDAAWPKRWFLGRVAVARTFGFLDDVEYLHSRSLALGASVENTVVFTDSGLMNRRGLRFADEPARHKLLDTLGDLAAIGGELCGQVVTHRAGHGLISRAIRRALFHGAIVRLP